MPMMDAINAIRRVNSPIKSINGLIPKVLYDDWGIFYDQAKDIYVKAEIESAGVHYLLSDDCKFGEITPVEPIAAIFPNKDGIYEMDEEELLDFVEADVCGEADDMSCYLYFNYC